MSWFFGSDSNRKRKSLGKRARHGWKRLKDYLPSILKALAIAIVGIGGPLGIFYGYMHVMTTDYFEVQNVRVEGNQRVSAEALKKEVFGTKADGKPNIFKLELAELRDRIKADYSWIRDLDLTTRLPDTVRIRLEEFGPEAVLKGTAKLRVVSGGGQVIDLINWSIYRDKYSDIPLLSGLNVEGKEVVSLEKYDKMLEVARWFGGLDIEKKQKLSEIHFDPITGISLVTEGGIEIRLGENKIRKRLDKFETMYPRIRNHSKNVDYILLDQFDENSNPEVVVGFVEAEEMTLSN